MGSTSNNNSGCGGVPPGFRFHPTDEELLHYYLKKKVSFHKFEMEVIRDIDLNKLEPWDLQERCRIGSTPQNEWYFFSHKDRKYPTGSRTNRATNAGFWKATGRDKCIRNTFQKIGMRKTLVFYRGRAPHGQKSDWIMHEYRLEDSDHTDDNSLQEDGWVVCRVFKKKNLFKIGGGAANEGGSSSTTTYTTNNNSNNNINVNSSSEHHHLLLNSTISSNNNNNNNIMHTNLQYYDLLRQQPPLPNHHYLMASHHPIFELNNKPEDPNNSHDHDLALHSYAPQHYYYGHHQPPPPAPTATSSDHHQDQWTMLDRIVTATAANSTSTTDHHHNNNDDDEAVLLLHSNNNVGMNNNQLSLGATTAVTTGTAEMDFWGGYAK